MINKKSIVLPGIGKNRTASKGKIINASISIHNGKIKHESLKQPFNIRGSIENLRKDIYNIGGNIR